MPEGNPLWIRTGIDPLPAPNSIIGTSREHIELANPPVDFGHGGREALNRRVKPFARRGTKA